VRRFNAGIDAEIFDQIMFTYPLAVIENKMATSTGKRIAPQPGFDK
jgi:hypothetical protein